jgi:hypothetical protein
MSQFSKFIHPGARRVEALVESVTNIEASAYKTDTSLVIVVINMNYSNTDLEFTIRHGSIDTLTKFTTSDTKNIVNDGGVFISDSIFNATVDSRSITTFASYTGNAGKYGNIIPVADAGSDIEVVDTDENGSETVMLDGTGSTDPDGVITNYSWSLDGFQISWEPTYEVDLNVGEFEFILTVTDNDGATYYDTVKVKVTSLNNTEIWLETECGQLGSTWNIPTDANASNGKYITVPAGIQSLASPSADSNDLLLFTFHLPEDGNYKIWGRVITPNADDDSFWVRMNDSAWVLWNSIPAGSTWHWDDVHDQNKSDQVVICELDTGYHNLTICFREDGALLDKIFIANTGVHPSGIGDTAENCPEFTTTGSTYNEISSVLIFPNPAENEIQVRWNSGFNSLVLIGMDGRKILYKNYTAPVQSINLNLNLEKGMYFLLLRNEKNSVVSKLAIE